MKGNGEQERESRKEKKTYMNVKREIKFLWEGLARELDRVKGEKGLGEGTGEG